MKKNRYRNIIFAFLINTLYRFYRANKKFLSHTLFNVPFYQFAAIEWALYLFKTAKMLVVFLIYFVERFATVADYFPHGAIVAILVFSLQFFTAQKAHHFNF